MRGKDLRKRNPRHVWRITPAYAGKSMVGKFPRRIHRDHPRLCGEKAKETKEFSGKLGSPPPMRGKAHALTSSKIYGRITPAYAGKSATVRHMRAKSRDHPRLCGEKAVGYCFYRRNEGSPPPMRGKVTILSPSTNHGGITPAYAGKRFRLLSNSISL